MKIAILSFSGATNVNDLAASIQRAGMEPVALGWDEPTTLGAFHGFILTDGEDEAPLGVEGMIEALSAQRELGKPMLGIGRGAQLLIESGLVPGLENDVVAVRLNADHTAAKDASVFIRLSNHYQRNAFTRHLTPKKILSAIVTLDRSCLEMTSVLLQDIENQGLNVFQYCDEQGNVAGGKIAAISNKGGNVMAMIPCPDLMMLEDAIFHSMREYIEIGHIEQVAPLSYYPRNLMF